MEYKGRYSAFDPAAINTYPVKGRTNKVKLENLIKPEEAAKLNLQVDEHTARELTELAASVVGARKKGHPVVLFTGAHLVKNGLSLLLGDLIKRGVFSLVAGNAATSIHDFELGLIGETSEYVPQALEKGEFGMAFEFNYINAALILGNRYKLGYGESVGRLINDMEFRKEAFSFIGTDADSVNFLHPHISLQSVCYSENVPLTIHAGIGTDVLDQHLWFDGEAKGGCSGRDFHIYANEIAGMAEGGVLLNIGSAVTGPEVFLKAASMAGNIGKVPGGLITANFDLRPYDPESFTNESAVGYYYRDQKSIVTRVPEAYGGKGHYIGGNQKDTFPLFYRKVLELL